MWRIEWSHAALAALRAMPWRQAARVDAAVQRLVATNEGDLVRAHNHPTGARLRVPPYVVYLTFDRQAGVLSVWYVYRN